MSTAESAATGGEVARDPALPPARGVRVDVPQTENEQAADGPKRIQLSRAKGWRKPEGAVVVSRPSKWGNPYRVIPQPDWPRWGGPRPSVVEAPDGELLYPAADRAVIVGWAAAEAHGKRLAAALAAECFAMWLAPIHRLLAAQAELAGHDLACWCALSMPCHADVLLEIANPDRGRRFGQPQSEVR